MTSEPRRCRLLAPGVIDQLVGVIDLKAGKAVHAVAGHRHQYAPIDRDWIECPGDAIEIARHYKRLGVRTLYVADLDAIEQRKRQQPLVERLLDLAGQFDVVLLDVGWRGDQTDRRSRWFHELAERFAPLRFVAATETASEISSLHRLCQQVEARQVVLGLDYRAGQLVARSGDETEWIGAAADLSVHGVLTLDVAAVGTAQGPVTMEACQRVKQLYSAATVYSGGGIRSPEDVDQLRQAGCDRCLAATALMAPAATPS